MTGKEENAYARGKRAALRDGGSGIGTPGQSGGERSPFVAGSPEDVAWLRGFRRYVAGGPHSFRAREAAPALTVEDVKQAALDLAFDAMGGIEG